MTYSHIQKRAEELFAQHGSEIPVPVVAIAKSLNLRIFIIRMPEFIDAIPSGVLSDTENYGWSIFLKNSDSLTRQRFTIAHELGHYLLHRGLPFVDSFVAGETFYRSDEDNELEKEANYFAACLLMPVAEVKKSWPQFSDPGQLAKHFQVSEVSMTYRLKNLGLIK